MADYTKPPQWKKEESDRLTGEAYQLKFIDLRFERRQTLGLRKARKGKTFHSLHVLGMNDDLRDRVCEVGSKTWKGVNELSFWWF